jgi:hypothetical protein
VENVKEESPFVVGAEVGVIISSNHRQHISIDRVKISKVYKNGNFVLEDRQGQWKTRRIRNGEWVALQAGERSYSSYHVVVKIFTSELLEGQEKIRLQRRALDAIDKINQGKYKIEFTADVAEMLEAIVALVGRAPKPTGTS